jgi:acetone carboxylase gamma subunit
MRKVIQEINEYLQIIETDGKKMISCRKCGYDLCSTNESYKKHALQHVGPITEVPRTLGPDVYHLDASYEFRQYFCPGCKVLFTSEFALKGEPLLDNFSFDL